MPDRGRAPASLAPPPGAPTAAEIMAWWDLDSNGKVDVRELITGLYAGGSVKSDEAESTEAAPENPAPELT